MSIIELKKITKEYAPNVGCFDIDMLISKGEVYGFIGPNGAGKTTLIRQMVGFIKSNKGSGTILGHDIWKDAKEIMKDLGYVAGEVSIPEYMTGFNYLKTIAGIRGNVDWNYAKKLIDYFELDSKRKIKKMSKGMKQKVSLIAAFMHKPKILILDEPTSGLDPLMQEKFIKLIKNFQNEGTTVFMSSHIFGEIDSVCDRVAVIKNGRIISEVSIKEMKNNFNRIYQINFADRKDYQDFLKKKWNIIKANVDKNQLKVEIDKKNVSAFLKEISKFNIDNFKEIPFSLEQHFMKYYKDEVNFDD